VRRAGAVLSMLVGATIVLAVFGLGLPGHAGNADAVLAGARPSVVGSDLLRADLEVTRRGVRDLVDRALPRTAAARGVPVDELLRPYPSTGAALASFEKTAASADATVSNLERQEPAFRSADKLRRTGVPLPAVPWGLAITGFAVVALGALGLAAPARAALAGGVIAALGASLIVVPLVIGAPAHLDDAAEVLASLKPDPAITSGQRAQITVIEAASKELPGLLAEVAQAQAGSTAIDEMVAAMPGTLERYGDAIGFREQHGADVAALKDLPVRQMAWMAPLTGAVITAAGLLLLVGGRRRTPPA
jgi:hypothetical protein